MNEKKASEWFWMGISTSNQELVIEAIKNGADLSMAFLPEEGNALHALLIGEMWDAAALAMEKVRPELLDEEDEIGRTPSILAASGPLSLFKKALERGGDVLKRDSNGNSILHFAASSGREEVCSFISETFPETLSMLDQKKRHAVIICIENDNGEGCETILHHMNKKELLSSLENISHSPLSLAISFGSKKCCASFLKYDDFKSKRDSDGWLPIHTAAMKGDLSALEALSEEFILSETNDGMTCLEIMVRYRCTDGLRDVWRKTLSASKMKPNDLYEKHKREQPEWFEQILRSLVSESEGEMLKLECSHGKSGCKKRL